MVISLELGADLHMAQLTPLPLTVSCFSKIQIGFAFLVPAHPGSPREKGPLNGCVCSSIVNGQPREPTLCQLYRHTLVRCTVMCYNDRTGGDVPRSQLDPT